MLLDLFGDGDENKIQMPWQNREQIMQGISIKDYVIFENVQRGSMI